MQSFESIATLQERIRQAKQQGLSIGFVPTMGNLHEGHLSLVRKAKAESDFIVVSIFVNPMQFGPNEDLDAYPRTLEDDKSKLVQEGCDALFFPNVDMIYPEGLEAHTTVSVPKLTQAHCGAARPGHFDGVTTIVNKLFNIVQADIAVFGEKDFQQLAVIRKMSNDLLIPTRIIGEPTARDPDGLALSSRNQYLSDQQRQIAPAMRQVILQTLEELKQSKLEPEDISRISKKATQNLENQGFKIDYFNIVDAEKLDQITNSSIEIVILAAAFLGKTRLIDNQTFSLNPVNS